jgi:hypothetical protein
LPAHPAIQFSVDHITPLDICPQFDHGIANLEMMSMRMTSSKNGRMGARQVTFVRKLMRAGLLTKKSPAVRAPKTGWTQEGAQDYDRS